MMKKIIYLILAVLTVALLATTVLAAGTETASGTCGENLTWKLDNEGTLTISGTGAMAMYSRVEPAPWYEMADDIKTLIVEDGVTIISATAFRECSNLEEVSLPNTLVKIGESAFYHCDSLTAIEIPDSVTTMGGSVFSFCIRLEQVKLPAGITEINQCMFQVCHSLKSITIPEGVTWIRKAAFVECNQLETVNFPSTLQVIDSEAFCYCYSLTEITIPDGVTQIGSWAFENCTGLVSVRIPASVTSLDYAFYDCSSLTGIWVDENNRYYSSDSFGVLYNKDKTVLEELPGGFEGEYVIPEGVRDINVMECAGLTKITVPGSVVDPLFSGCENLTNVVYQEGVEHIGKLYHCNNLSSVSIPASVTVIDEAAFNDCEYLRHVLYTGNEAQWNAINIGEYNANLTKTTIHYDASGDEMISLEIVEGKKCHEQEILQCTICNRILKGKNHAMSDEWVVVSYPSCTQDAEERRYCKHCDFYEVEKQPAHGHDYRETVTAPSCLEKGFTTYSCSICGDTYTDNFTEPKGHNYVNDVCLGCGDVRASYAPGDHDKDGDVDVDDVLTLLWHVLFPDTYPLN